MSTPAAPTTDLPELTRPQKVATMAATLLGLLLAALDQTIVATAGPVIQHDLGIPPGLYAWITTAYMVASTVLVPIWGKLSDLYGRRTILLVGMTTFLLGSALCGVAQTTLQLIVFRAVQGIGSASLFTTAFAVIADLFPPAERGKYQGIYGSVFALSSVVGPLAGGFISDRVGWHWVFFVNLPIGALALGFVATRMPALLRPRRTGASIDLAGAFALVLAVVPLLLALSVDEGAPGRAGVHHWTAPSTLALLGLSLAGVVAFVAVERRAIDPILDLRLFGDAAFARGNAAAFVLGSCFLGAIVFLPLFMVNVVGLSATRSGLTTTPLTFGIVAGNIVSGQLVARLGRYKAVIVGSVLLLLGAFALMGFTLSVRSTATEVTLKMILMGLGMGPTIPLFTLVVQNAVPPRQIGVATASATFFRQMGSTIGVAVLGTVFATTLAAHARGPLQLGALDEAGRQAFTIAIARLYQLCAGIALVGLLITLALPERPLRRGSTAPPISE